MVFLLKQKTIKMAKKLTLDDLIIEEHPGGQNCRSCPLCEEPNTTEFCDTLGIKCMTHTITIKPTTDEQL